MERDGSANRLLASGGIASLDDLRRVKELGCEGAIVGSAIWLGRFSLAAALALADGWPGEGCGRLNSARIVFHRRLRAGRGVQYAV